MEFNGQISTLNLFLLMRCNLNCHFCMSNSGPHRKEKMSLELALKIANEVKEWPYLLDIDYPVIRLTGGEPLLYKELDSVLEAFSFSPKIEISTNGTLMTKRKASTLSKNNVTLNLSIYTDQRGIPILTQGKIVDILDSGIPTAFVVTLTAYNIDFLESILDFLENLGANVIVINYVKPRYKITAKEYYSYSLKSKEFLKVHNTIRTRIDREVIYIYGNQTNPDNNDTEPGNSIGCNCDYKQLSILSDGRVVPCSSLIENVVGNVYEDSIINIYKKCHERFQPNACLKIT